MAGPRIVPGCDAAFTVLEWHCPMLAGDGEDVHAKPLRKEMAAAVLELLGHDRCQTLLD